MQNDCVQRGETWGRGVSKERSFKNQSSNTAHRSVTRNENTVSTWRNVVRHDHAVEAGGRVFAILRQLVVAANQVVGRRCSVADARRRLSRVVRASADHLVRILRPHELRRRTKNAAAWSRRQWSEVEWAKRIEPNEEFA